MNTSQLGRWAIGALAVLVFAVQARDLAAQQRGVVGALAPENLAKQRPKPPFDLTGAWLHNGNERFDPPAGFVLTPEAKVHYDAAQKATAEGKLYRNDIGLCWPAGLPIMMTRGWPVTMIQLPTAVYMIS